MNTSFLRWAGGFLLAPAVLAFTSCASVTSTGETASDSPQGAITVDTFTTTAKVAAVDQAKRKVTLEFRSGSRTTYKVGPEAVGFGELKAGDQVSATLTEEVAVQLGRGAVPAATAGPRVALAPVGSKGGGVVVDTVQMTARLGAVGVNKVTLEYPDGTTKTLKVGARVDLSAFQPGDEVTAQVTEGLAIAVEKR